jgi:diphthine-ammonia ligase
MKVAVSWSAGKDSCLAWLRAREAGADVRCFLTMCEPDGHSKSHALPPALLQAQCDAAGVHWLPVRVPPGAYAACFADALAQLHDDGYTHLVFGDIDLQAHRDWLEPACQKAGLLAWFPLWGCARAALAQEVLARGIRARLVCVDTRWLDDRHAGAEYDAALLARLPEGVCCCGEGGEFHTFVWDAPGFGSPLQVQTGPLRRVRSAPPLAPTELLLCTPELA